MKKLPQLDAGSGALLELQTPAELAAQLRVTQETLANWRVKQAGPRFLRVGGQIRYRLRDVDTWLNAQQEPDHD